MSKPSPVVSEAGTFLSFVQGVEKEIRALGGTFDDWKFATTPGGEKLCREIAKLMVAPRLVREERFMVAVNYDKPLGQLMNEGNIRWSNLNPVSKFTVSGKGLVAREVFLLQFNKRIKSKDAIKIMAVHGYVPSPVEDLVAFCPVNPYTPVQAHIIALGSEMDCGNGKLGIPTLWGPDSDFGGLMELEAHDEEWNTLRRFLARRKAA